jgi:hypothetical protein
MRIQRVFPRKAWAQRQRVRFHSLRAGVRILLNARHGRRARRAILVTLLALVCFRIGFSVGMPGVDFAAVWESYLRGPK